MSIQSFIKKVCVQDAIYWEYDGMDEFTSPKFKEAVGIKVRWDEKSELIAGNDGIEIVSNAQLLTPINLVEQSQVLLGSMDDYPLEPVADDYENTYEIKKMERYPTFKSKTLDVFIAYL